MHWWVCTDKCWLMTRKVQRTEKVPHCVLIQNWTITRCFHWIIQCCTDHWATPFSLSLRWRWTWRKVSSCPQSTNMSVPTRKCPPLPLSTCLWVCYRTVVVLVLVRLRSALALYWICCLFMEMLWLWRINGVACHCLCRCACEYGKSPVSRTG